jgi:hypothetical protein
MNGFLKLIKILLVVIFSFISVNNSYSWGFWAHKRINYYAVFTLPSEVFGFYKTYINFLYEHSVDADKRRHIDPEEAHKHYIDLELFKENFDSLPKFWDSALNKFSYDTLKQRGTLPWQIQFTYYRLVSSLKNKNLEGILRNSADLGHYVSDAHVPLHTTENYNGQLTNQKGIHALWESRVPELVGKDYQFWTNKAEYIENKQNFIWEIIKQSNSLVDSVLTIEKKLTLEFGEDKKYSIEERNGKTVKTYSKEFCIEYNNQLNEMAHKQMQKNIWSLGCFWYSAWIDAGQPNLEIYKSTNNENKELYQPEIDPYDLPIYIEMMGRQEE